MRILRAQYAQGADFIKEIVKDEIKGRRIIHKTKIPLAEKEPVILEILFPALPNRVLIRGRVAEVEESGEERKAFITVDAEDEEALDFLIGRAKAPDVADHRARKHDRVPIGIPVDWQVEGSGDVIISATDDVGIGGVQIRTLSPPPVGTELTLKIGLNPSTREIISIPGKVAWVKQDEQFQGMGVEFLPTDAEDKRPLRELLQNILTSGEIGGDTSTRRADKKVKEESEDTDKPD